MAIDDFAKSVMSNKKSLSKTFSKLPGPLKNASQKYLADRLGNKGLVLKKNIGKVLNIIENIAGISTASKSEKGLNVQREFNWVIVLPDLSNMKGLKSDGVNDLCIAVDFQPYKLADKTDVKYGAYKRSYPGMLSISDLTATFVSTVPMTVESYFERWFALMVDKKGRYYPKNTYAKDIRVMLLHRDGQSHVTYKLGRCFPTSLSKVELSYNGGSYLKYTVVLNVDTFDVEMQALQGASPLQNPVSDLEQGMKTVNNLWNTISG